MRPVAIRRDEDQRSDEGSRTRTIVFGFVVDTRSRVSNESSPPPVVLARRYAA